jgi:hypothetical protein
MIERAPVHSGEYFTENARDEVEAMLRQMRQAQLDVHAARQNKKEICFELEARFGSFSADGKFRSGCQKMVMNHLLAKFEEASCETFEKTPWSESQDTFFRSSHVAGMVRGTCYTDEASLTMHCSNVLKTRTACTHCAPSGSGACGDSRQGWRISLSAERNLPDEIVPCLVEPVFTRIKQRKSFRYRNSNGSVVWRFDFTLVWSGVNRTEAEQKQFSEEPAYEFEVELEYAHPDVSERYISEALLLKLYDQGPGMPLDVIPYKISGCGDSARTITPSEPQPRPSDNRQAKRRRHHSESSRRLDKKARET